MTSIPTPAKELLLLDEVVAPSTRRRLTRFWPRLSLAVDAVMAVAAVTVASLAASRAGLDSPPKLWLVAYPLLVLALLAAFGSYGPRLRARLLDDLRFILGATAIAAMAVVSAGV